MRTPKVHCPALPVCGPAGDGTDPDNDGRMRKLKAPRRMRAFSLVQRALFRVGRSADGPAVSARSRWRPRPVQVLGSVTPVCPWYLPSRSRYEVSQNLVGLDEDHLGTAFVA